MRKLSLIVTCVLVISVCGSFIINWDIGYNSDVAMIGLMAKQIARLAEFPLFVWTVNYQGVLMEAYPAALLFSIFGGSPLALSLVPLTYTLIFLVLLFRLIKSLWGFPEAILTIIFLTLSAPDFYVQLLRTLPNYAPLHLLAVTSFILYFKIIQIAKGSESRTRLADLSKFLCLLGIVQGFAYYTFSLSAVFIASVFACFFLFAGAHYRSSGSIGVSAKPFLRSLQSYTIGLTVGYLPALVFTALGGQMGRGPKVSITLDDLIFRGKILLESQKRFLNFESASLVSQLSASVILASAFFFLVSIFVKLFQTYIHGTKNDLRLFGSLPFAIYPAVLCLAFLTSPLVGDIGHRRWLNPLLMAYALAVATSIVWVWNRYSNILWRLLIVSTVLLVLSNNSMALYKTIQSAGNKRRTLERDAHAFFSRNLTRGFAPYWRTYATNLMYDEKIILQPLDVPYNPNYAKIVFAEKRVGLIVNQGSPFTPVNGQVKVSDHIYRVVDEEPLDGNHRFYSLELASKPDSAH